MTTGLWFVVIGAVLVLMALVGSALRRLPVTASMLYLGIGIILGPASLGWLVVDPLATSSLLERVTEIIVVVSLFAAGLKLRTPLRHGRWRLPLRLAFVSMTLTVGLVTLVGVVWLGLPLGAAVLLGAVLAPTDPVLASEVQVTDPWDRDRLRFGLTAEAGLNDGTAFPFVMLGLGLLGLHELGAGGWRWLALDLGWSVAGGLLIGWLLGVLIARLVLYLRREHREAVGLDDFLALGLIGLSYGVALMLGAYGFLAVFAAGLALRRIELDASGAVPPRELHETEDGELTATSPERAPAYMAQVVLGFNEQLERIGEVGVVILVGSLLAAVPLPGDAMWFAPALFLVIRPLAVLAGLLGSQTSGLERALIAWFGIRGIGSIYYLMFALQHGVAAEQAERLTSLTLWVVAISILVHGISVTPLMRQYRIASEPMT